MIQKLFRSTCLGVVLIAVPNLYLSYASEENSLVLFKNKTIDTSVKPSKALHPSLATTSQLSHQKVYLIVQFQGPVTQDTRKQVQKVGGEFLSYVPESAFIIRISERFSPLLSNIKTIKWVGDYEPELKLSAALTRNDAANEEQVMSLHVKLFSGEKSGILKSVIQKYAGTILYDKKDVVKVLVKRKSISELSQIEGVEWIEEAKKPVLLNYFMSEEAQTPLIADDDKENTDPYATLTGFESGVKLLQVQQAYAAGVTGEGQIVGVADTGLDLGNVNNQLSDDFSTQVSKGYALGFFSQSWADPMGHGTHVTGSILGRGAYSKGLLAGVAQDSKVVVQGLMGDFGDLNIPPDLSDLFEPVYKDGVRIHSNSWGHDVDDYDQFARSLDKVVWENPDLVILVAAGNSGEDLDQDGVIDSASLGSPSIAKNCITVGASENYVLEGGIQKMWGKTRDGQKKWGTEPIASDMISDNPNGIAAFSSRGPTVDGRLKPDVVAPGTNILSARSHHPKAEKLWGEFNEHYLWSGGTSMSTPLTAGAATLVRQFYMDKMEEKSVSAALVKATLINGALDLYPGQFGFSSVKEIPTVRPNVHEGWGRVDIENSLFPKHRSILYTDEPDGVKQGEAKEYTVTVTNSSEPLRVTLVYSDYPGATVAFKALVNDLDLTVVEGTKKFFPNGKDIPDRVNNVEGIDIVNPAKGTYTIQVSAYRIPQGKNGAQPYALVISGGIE